jgi:hypothetical protein
MDGAAQPLIGAAAADIGEIGIDVGIGRIGVVFSTSSTWGVPFTVMVTMGSIRSAVAPGGRPAAAEAGRPTNAL